MADSKSLVGARPLTMIRASCAGSSLQLSSVIVVNPAGPCSSSTGSASASGTPDCVNEGPIARRIRCLGPVPVMMNPPMPTLSPVWTRVRVERFRGCAAGVGVPEGVGDGGTVGVADGATVGVPVGVVVAVAVGGGTVIVPVGVALAVLVTVGVAVAVAVGVAEGATVAVAVAVAVAVGVGVDEVGTLKA